MKGSFFSSNVGLALLAVLAVANSAFSLNHMLGGSVMPALLSGVAALAWIVLLVYSLTQRK